MKSAPWTRTAGLAIAAIPGLLTLLTAVVKISHQPDAVDAFVNQFGLGESALVPIGCLQIVCGTLYLARRSSFFGAILLTGYFGGAIVMEIRAERMVVVPVVLAILVWIGLALRVPAVAAALVGAEHAK